MSECQVRLSFLFLPPLTFSLPLLRTLLFFVMFLCVSNYLSVLPSVLMSVSAFVSFGECVWRWHRLWQLPGTVCVCAWMLLCCTAVHFGVLPGCRLSILQANSYCVDFLSIHLFVFCHSLSSMWHFWVISDQKVHSGWTISLVWGSFSSDGQLINQQLSEWPWKWAYERLRSLKGLKSTAFHDSSAAWGFPRQALLPCCPIIAPCALLTLPLLLLTQFHRWYCYVFCSLCNKHNCMMLRFFSHKDSRWQRPRSVP